MSFAPRNMRGVKKPKEKTRRDSQNSNEMFTLNLTRGQLFLVASALNEYEEIQRKKMRETEPTTLDFYDDYNYRILTAQGLKHMCQQKLK